MGGLGSGRPGWKNKAEDFRSVDVNKMRRAGALSLGSRGYVQWNVGGETDASIRYRMEDEGLRLSYRVCNWDEEWEDIDYVVPIRYRACRFGGARPYFICPGVRNGMYCGRTVCKLYGGRYFVCRHCQGLAYASQSEQRHDRLLRKANKKRMALGGEPGTASWLPERPKGMWRRTYDREIEEILKAEELADAHFMAWFSRRFPGQAERGNAIDHPGNRTIHFVAVRFLTSVGRR